MPGSVESIGLSIVVLSLVFASAALIRRWSRPLRKLFMPTAVIGGFLVLGLGPEGMGRLIGGSGVFPDDVFAVWKQMPGVLVTVSSELTVIVATAPRVSVTREVAPSLSIWRAPTGLSPTSSAIRPESPTSPAA
jgi:hypothetical protein